MFKWAEICVGIMGTDSTLIALWRPDLVGEMMTIPKTLLNIKIACAGVLQEQMHLWTVWYQTDNQPAN